MTSLQTLRVGCAVAMIIGVFLPWVSIFGAKLHGHNILSMADRTLGFGTGRHASMEDLLLFLPLVILILATVTILMEIAASPKTRRISVAGLLTGVSPFVGLTYFGSLVGRGGLEALAVGSYLVLAAAGILLVASFDHDSASGKTGTPNIETSSGS